MVGDEALYLVNAVADPLLRQVEGVELSALPVLHAVRVHTDQVEFLPPYRRFVKGDGAHVVADLDQRAAGAQQAHGGVVGPIAAHAIVNALEAAEEVAVTAHADVDFAAAGGLGRRLVDFPGEHVIRAQPFCKLLAGFDALEHPHFTVGLDNLDGLHHAQADGSAAHDQHLFALLRRRAQHRVDGNAGGFDHHGLFVGQLVIDMGKAAGGVDEAVAPARAGGHFAVGRGRAVVEAEVVVALLAVAAALADALGVAAGHVGADGDAVAHLEVGHVLANLGDHAHIFMAQIGALGAGNRLERGIGAGGGLEKTHVGTAQAAGDVAHAHPVPGGQLGVGNRLVLDGIQPRIKQWLTDLGGRLGQQYARYVLFKVNGFQAPFPLYAVVDISPSILAVFGGPVYPAYVNIPCKMAI